MAILIFEHLHNKNSAWECNKMDSRREVQIISLFLKNFFFKQEICYNEHFLTEKQVKKFVSLV